MRSSCVRAVYTGSVNIMIRYRSGGLLGMWIGDSSATSFLWTEQWLFKDGWQFFCSVFFYRCAILNELFLRIGFLMGHKLPCVHPILLGFPLLVDVLDLDPLIV